jgi:pyruvate dehydrogenase E1 component
VAAVAALREGIVKGMYSLTPRVLPSAQVQLLGCGAILGEVIAAARMLEDEWNIEAAIWSVTSFSELHRDGTAAERKARFDLDEGSARSHVETMLRESHGPVVAATDYVRAVPELIRAFVPRRYVTLGTDGFGRSDTRRALREFFEIDRGSIVIAALKALADDGDIERGIVRAALDKYGRHLSGDAAPWQR